MIGLITPSWQEIYGLIEYCKVDDRGILNEMEFNRLTLDSTPIIVIKSGVGIKNARISANQLIQKFGAEKVIIAGVAGALSPDLEIGNIIVGKWVSSSINNRKIDLMHKLDTYKNSVITGGILTHNKFINKKYDKKLLYKNSQALVVDMETWGAAEVCENQNKQITAIRSVSDLSCDDLPDMGYILNKNGSLKTANSIRYFSTHPNLLLRYIEFKYFKLKKASVSLSDYLVSYLKNSLS